MARGQTTRGRAAEEAQADALASTSQAKGLYLDADSGRRPTTCGSASALGKGRSLRQTTSVSTSVKKDGVGVGVRIREKRSLQRKGRVWVWAG